MKKIIIVILLIVLVAYAILFLKPKNDNKEISNNTEIVNTNTQQNTGNSNNTITTENRNEKEMYTAYIKVNNKVLDIELEDNSATKELRERLENGDVVINAHEYGGFEKVGDLGFSLPREDKNITTLAGDIVLYQGNQISLFYKSNSWNYTKLGKIIDIDNDELKNILGNGDVTLTFTLSI